MMRHLKVVPPPVAIQPSEEQLQLKFTISEWIYVLIFFSRFQEFPYYFHRN